MKVPSNINTVNSNAFTFTNHVDKFNVGSNGILTVSYSQWINAIFTINYGKVFRMKWRLKQTMATESQLMFEEMKGELFSKGGRVIFTVLEDVIPQSSQWYYFSLSILKRIKSDFVSILKVLFEQRLKRSRENKEYLVVCITVVGRRLFGLNII